MAVLVLGTLATSISYILYRESTTDKYIRIASNVTEYMLKTIDADSVEAYLESGVTDEAYIETERRLAELRDSMSDIEYMYVYQIRPDGCHVVFDVDTPELAGEALGTVLEPDDAFAPQWDKLLSGERIEPVVSNEKYGWLLTVYTPMLDSSGKCVAYAAADVAMSGVLSDRYAFIVKVVSLLFSAAILIVMATISLVDNRLVAPINAMADAAGRFAYESEEERLKSTDEIRSLGMDTGDELENLYNALTKTVTDIAEYITDINQKNELITRMQDNIIVSFANMVEARDSCTGSHIMHTSGYVAAIAEQLKRESRSDTLTDGYLRDLSRSAPLHDIGKIKVPDAILNKPGKLTAEEFDTMKTHTVAGREILRGAVAGFADAGYLSMAMDMAAYHHERWDGRGYPEALAGAEIPLCARIMAVADVFDALISKRSYKDGMPLEAARAVILEESGTHFDPEVVEAFIAAWDTVAALSAKTE